MSLKSVSVSTQPFEGQKPGTSGLRKKVKVFMEKHYTENFIQAYLDTIKPKLRGSTLIVGGDGRYFTTQAINIIIRITAANEVGKLIIGRRGLLSTPAVSSLIRTYNTLGGIILTASHNPGGIRHDFGIKYNIDNGGPAPDSLTNDIFERTKTISEYRIVPDLDCDFQQPGVHIFQVDGREFVVEVIDSEDNYVELMKSIFDFGKLSNLLKGTAERPPFNVLIDSMNGGMRHVINQMGQVGEFMAYLTHYVYVSVKVDVEYVVRGETPSRGKICHFGRLMSIANIQKLKKLEFEWDHKELNSNQDSAIRIIPLDNFGEIHPDPNLTYAKDLVDKVREDTNFDFGAAFDGDGDRNMIIGKNAFFVTPSDSLAVIANNLDCIPYFRKNGVKGFARSMPTAAAVDRVAQKLGKEIFETPTGWKYFGNLMDVGRLSLCGEESFGTGSDHIREKDGIWAVLAWLSIIEAKKMSVQEILEEHWRNFGRNYFVRYDYEEVDSNAAVKMMAHLDELIGKKDFIGTKLTARGKTFVVDKADNFSYVDPVDKSVVDNQGVRILFKDGSRLVFRLSGTGSSGATIRVYIESYEDVNVTANATEMLAPLVSVALLQISKIFDFTGREEPTVIT